MWIPTRHSQIHHPCLSSVVQHFGYGGSDARFSHAWDGDDGNEEYAFAVSAGGRRGGHWCSWCLAERLIHEGGAGTRDKFVIARQVAILSVIFSL